MAEVPDLFLLPLEEADGEGEEDQEELDCKETPDPVPYWSSASDHAHPSCDNDLFIPVFSSNFPFPGRRISPVSYDSDPEYDPGSDYLEDQLTLSVDLFDRSPAQLQGGGTMDPFPEILDSSDFRVLDRVEDMGSDYLGLGLGLGLGSRFERQEEEEEEDGVGGNQEMGSDWGGDEFFFGSSVSQSVDRPIDRHMDREGLRIVGFGSDSDSEDDQISAIGSNPNGGNAEDRISDDVGVPLCWDCLRIDDRGGQEEEFEWEEVDGRLDEREVLSMMFAADDDRSSRELDADLEEEVSRNVEWEVLLAVNNLGRNPSMEPEDAISDLGNDSEEFINPSEYEILFGQFIDHESSIRGSPPAAKSLVDSLPSIVLSPEDKANNNTLCAVCKDEIPLEEMAKKLPCSHHYHSDCILPWLRIRNTCPVCRYELPTDDPEYESWKARRASGGAAPTEDPPVRYDFEMFPEA